MAEPFNYLSVSNLSKSYGIRTLFSGLTFGIAQGERVALIAKNGTGKTSMFRIIVGEDTPDTGEVVFRRDIKIGYLSQDPHFSEHLTVIDAVLQGDDPALKAVRHYEHMLHHHETTKELQDAIDAVEHHNAWNLEAQVKEILSRLCLLYTSPSPRD